MIRCFCIFYVQDEAMKYIEQLFKAIEKTQIIKAEAIIIFNATRFLLIAL